MKVNQSILAFLILHFVFCAKRPTVPSHLLLCITAGGERWNPPQWAALQEEDHHPHPHHAFIIGHASEATWQSVQRMNFARSSVSLVGIGKRLYALGGMQDGGFTALVEMYDTETNEWHNVENMGEARCNPGVAVAGGKIYVVGGVGDRDISMRQGPERFTGALRTVEYYDVNILIRLCRWYGGVTGYRPFFAA